MPPRLLRVAAVVAVVTGLVAVVALSADRHPGRTALVLPGRGMPQQLREVNYYPADDSWYRMWTHWDAATVDRDFGRARSIGANTVRLIVFPAQFGFPDPSRTMRDRLAQAIGLAARHGLRVHLTLYDHFERYDELAASRTWTRALLAPYAGDLRVPVVEVRNEVDPHDRSLIRWLRDQITLVRAVLPGTAVTVSTDSTSGPGGPAQLRAALRGTEPDFFDYHYYGPAAAAYDTFRRVRNSVAPAPLFIGETGRSTTAAGPPDAVDADYSSMIYLAKVENAAAMAFLPPPAPWTLNDFTPAGDPYDDVDPKEFGFGLFDTGGAPKAAAFAVARAFGAAPGFVRRHPSPVVLAPTSRDSNNPGFGVLIPSEHRPAAWQHGTGAADYDVARGGAPSGGNTARIARSSGTADFVTTPSEVVQGGQQWSLRATVRGSGSTGVTRIALVWLDAAGHRIGESGSPALATGTTRWTGLQVTAVAPPDAVDARIVLESDGNRGAADFADVSWSVDGRGSPQQP